VKYKAVIFDLFGTLVPNMSLSGYRAVLVKMAHLLSIPTDDFLQLWFDTFNERCTGIFKAPDENIRYICQTISIPVNETQMKLATYIKFEHSARSMIPRADAIETLSHLKSAGYKIGLISDCSAEAPTIWPDTPLSHLFDVTSFSCEVGIKKPDPRIYRLTTKQLGIKPQNCLYVGDGSSRELTGAAQVGMHPVLLRVPQEDNADVHRVDAETGDWDGPTISSLSEVLDLMK